MAILLCAPSSLALTKANTVLQLQQKPNSLVSFPSVRSQTRDNQSKRSPLPLFSRTHLPQTQLSSRTSTTATKASSDSQNSTGLDLELESEQTVEHVGFLQVREDKTKPWGVADALNSMRCVPGVLYLSAGNVGETYGAPGTFNFFIHSRHATKNHRNRFMQHPLKYGFSMGYTEALCDDFMILDYIFLHVNPQPNPVYGSALRFVFLKLKHEVIDKFPREVIHTFFPGSAAAPSYGPIIEPCFTIPGTETNDCLKGYNFAMHGAYASKADLDASGSPDAFAEKMKNKLGEELVQDDHSVFVHDYIVDKVYGGTFIDHDSTSV